MVEAIKRNYPQREVAEASFTYQREVDSGQRIVVGVNGYTEGGEGQIETLRVDQALERKQIGRLQAVRARRDAECLERCLSDLREAAATERNLMYPLIECARAGASEGEIVESLQQVFGTYTETPVF
jgi:methylmalonyl-CoA mutase N-terminal domain/subunit